MAIGTAAAIGIGLAGVGSAASAISGNNASKRAAETSQQNNTANTALAREIYGSNRQVLNPFVQRGNAAGSQINALLGLGGGTQNGVAQVQTNAQGMPVRQPNALAQFQGQNPRLAAQFPNSFSDNPPARADMFPGGQQMPMGRSPLTGGAGLPYGIGDNFINYTDGMGNTTTPNQTQQPGYQITGGQTAQEAAEGAFDIFRNSTGYQFRLGEGLDAVNSGYAGAGTLQSGAALRAISDYGQNMASNEFANYMNALASQQAVGAGSASSLAGVGQNFAGTVINSNNANAANQMNAQLSRQNGLANAAGILGGGLFQYGLGG